MTIIGFLAKKRYGKDTACDYLVKNYGYTKNSFASPIKKGIKEWFNFTDEQIYGEKKDDIDKLWGVSPREVLQVMGTEVVRNQFKTLFPNLMLGDKSSFWIKCFDIWYERNYCSHKGNVVISDVRFQDEVDYIKSKGGIVIKIMRIEKENNIDNHESESGIDKITNIDVIIENFGTLEKFYSKIDNSIKSKVPGLVGI